MGFSSAANASNQGTQLAMLAQAQQAAAAQNAIQHGQNQAVGALQQGQTSAVDALKAAQNQGINVLGQYYGQGVGYQQPYMNAGTQATNQLAAMYAPGGQYGQMPTAAQLQMDPSYSWRFQQGQQAAQNAIAAGIGGASVGGSALKAITDYGQNAASQEYSNAYNHFMQQAKLQTGALQNIAGTGAGAANQATALAGQTGANQANLYANTGQNLASTYGTTGSNLANTYTGADQQLAANYNALGQNIGQGYANIGANNASAYMGPTNLMATLAGQALGAGATYLGMKARG